MNTLKYEIYDDNINLWLVSTHSMRYDDIIKGKTLVYTSDTKYGTDGAYTYLTDKGIEPYYKDDKGFFEIYV